MMHHRFFFICHSERSEESDELLSVAKNTYTIAFQILPPFGRLDDKGRKG